jgi:hypothetical protein
MDTTLIELCAEPQLLNLTPSVSTNPNEDSVGTICWVARAVYGVEDGRWLLFRSWLLKTAPAWFRNLYIQHGEMFASWVDDKPAMKSVLRRFMDRAIQS